MPGWTAGNAVIAVALSLACRKTAAMKHDWLRRIILIGVIIVSTAVGILGLKSVVEMALYGQPFILRAAKNVYAFAADVVVITLSLPLAERLESVIKRLFRNEMTVVRQSKA